MMVGSIKTTVQEGQQIKRGDEFGYFAFGTSLAADISLVLALTSGCRCFAGGSTIVVLFEKSAAVEWDEDLLINSKACLETLVRVGMGLGRGKRKQVTDDTN